MRKSPSQCRHAQNREMPLGTQPLAFLRFVSHDAMFMFMTFMSPTRGTQTDTRPWSWGGVCNRAVLTPEPELLGVAPSWCFSLFHVARIELLRCLQPEFAQNSAANNHLLGRSSVTSLPAMYANAMNNAAWSLSMDLGEKQYCAQYDDYGYDYEGNFQDWMYYVDEIETTDTGSYTPSEVETIEAFFDPCGTTPTVNSPMGGSVKVLAPDPLVHKQPQSPVLVLLVLARSR